MAEDKNQLQEYEVEPDIESLRDDFHRCRRNLNYYLDINEEARDVRRNNWPGKSKSGRKESADAFPWQNSSDLEANLVEPLVSGDIAILKSAVNKSNLVAAPTESGDIASASIVSQFMRWRISTMEELPREVSCAANMLLETGVAFVGVHFRQEVTRVLKPITLEEISNASPELATAIADDEMKESALEMLQGTFPTLSKKRLRKMLRELRDGSTEIPVDKTVVSRPTLRSYELGRDLIVDSNILDLDSARAIYTVTYLTPEQLRAKIRTDNFDEDFCDELIENHTGSYDHNYSGFSGAALSGQNEAPEHFDGLVRLVTAYTRDSDEDGIPMVCVTMFSDADGVEGYAKKFVMSVDGGRYPFVAITREQLSRRLLDSRGYPEILRSYQDSCKSEMDARRDAASLSTCPPLEYVVGSRPERLGAGAQVAVRRRGMIGYLETPRPHPASMEVEMQIRDLANKLTGRATTEADMVEANIVRQGMVNNFLHGFSLVLRKMWALDREYNAEVFFRVSNSEQGMNLVMQDQGNFDFTLSFNAANLEEKAVIEKLTAVGQIMSQYDRQGQARYDVFLRTFLDAIDPNLASQLIMPAEEATTKEIIETSNDLAKIASGQVVNAPEGANGQLRMQVIQQYLQGTEQIPGTDVQQRLEQDENFRARMETYSGQLQHQLQQQQNALTGQLGTPPGNVPGSVAA